MDTIFALATAQGRAGVSVIRVSGPEAKQVARQFCTDLPEARNAGLRVLIDQDGHLLDHGLVLTFDGPASFTGEDIVEFHLHGSIAVVAAMLRALGQTRARLADPGEFTKRALQNDKMDLAQVEGLGDLIEAETEAQRQQALRVVSGKLGERIELWRAKLIRAAALVEVTIDFADEEVPVDVSPEVQALVGEVRRDIDAQLEGFQAASCIRTGFEVAIVGAPNTGKSTLLNALAQRDAAITSEIAGTTRDVIEVRMDLSGLPVTLLDTAGLRDAHDQIEAEGVARAMSRANAADLRIFLVEPTETLDVNVQDGDVVRAPKADVRDDGVAAVSGKTGEGIEQLVSDITNSLLVRSQSAGLVTHERHRMSMKNAQRTLESASSWVGVGADHYDIAAEELRTAIRSLEAVVGRVDVENVLDEIFSSFCLGK